MMSDVFLFDKATDITEMVQRGLCKVCEALQMPTEFK